MHRMFNQTKISWPFVAFPVFPNSKEILQFKLENNLALTDVYSKSPFPFLNFKSRFVQCRLVKRSTSENKNHTEW